MTSLLNRLNPISEEHQYLASSFALELGHALRSLLRIFGVGIIISVIVISIIDLPMYPALAVMLGTVYSLLLLSGLAMLQLAFSSALQSYFFLRVLTVVTVQVVLVGIVALLLEDMFRSLTILLVFTLLSAFFPWLISWHLILQSIILTVGAIVYSLLFRQGLITGSDNFLAVLILTTTGLAIYFAYLMGIQRWKSFLTRHQVFLLNAEVQSANMQLEELNGQMSTELQLARDVQESLLPDPKPNWPGWDIVCYSQPAREVGGDFYNYRSFGEGRSGLAVGDISGKGAGAALLMASMLSLFDSKLSEDVTPRDLLLMLDSSFHTYTKSYPQNCALCYVSIDHTLLTIANAGGIPPYVRRQNGSVRMLEAFGLPLGQELGQTVGYTEVSLELLDGDFIVMVSDGILEVERDGEIFGFERFEAAIASSEKECAQGMVNHILGRVQDFTGDAELVDDITIVVMRRD